MGKEEDFLEDLKIRDILWKATQRKYLDERDERDKKVNLEKEKEDLGRYNTFYLTFKNKNVSIDTEFCELLVSKIFDRYKIGLVETPPYLSVIGYTKTRKRIQSIERAINLKIIVFVKENIISQNEVEKYSFSIKKSDATFDKAIPEGEFILGDGSEIGYFGKDVALLDQVDKRFSWQNSLLDLIFDQKINEFRIPDDRTIIWIFDEKGCTGKSKFVKWMCVNRQEEVAKIMFGTAGQLRSSFIFAGVRKCYFLDIPRTIGSDDSLESIISAIEDLKNGHLVSNFYGRYQQLIMEPPHVIIFSNQKCPRKMMSDDRWVVYEIKNQDLKKSY